MVGSGNAKKSPGAHVASREMERKKSPPSHWYNGVAEDSSHDNRSRSHHTTGGTWRLHIHVTMAIL